MLKDKYLKYKFNLAERRSFYELIAGYLDSNVAFSAALESMYMRAKRNKDYKAHIYKDILDKLGNGLSISTALHKWVPANEHMLIEAGEKSSKMADSFKEAVYLADSISKIKQVVFGNMFTPFLMILILFGMMVGFRVKMVTIFLEFMPIEDWPTNAANIYAITDFVYRNWVLILAILIGSTALIFGTINDFTGKLRTICDKIPPYNVYKKFAESSFLITFASLLKANYPIMDSLRSMDRNATRYLKYYLTKMMDNIGSGMSEGEALNVGLLNKELAGVLEDTSKLANFEEAVHNIGKRNIEKSVEEVTAMMKTINMVLVSVILIFTLFMFFSIQELSFSVSESITKS